ncbi:MAG TPA: YMGG-like glycine zipper-containing protein [Xanthomonadales bacterium]|nr:YMGG-like glycine zipper-containing protein [Xanthomonadales bacterium]
MKPVICVCICGALLAWSINSFGQAPIIYPAGGQSPEQQQKDQGECQAWATQNTGIDPAALAAAPPPESSSSGGGERVRGAARGAVGGAAIGAIAGDTGEGAAIGAVVGTMAGGRRARHNQAAQEQAGQAQKQQQIDTWYRAVGACMTARNYTVS